MTRAPPASRSEQLPELLVPRMWKANDIPARMEALRGRSFKPHRFSA
jgi:hypothetical protein